MTGFPFFRILVLVLLFGAATWPLIRLTSGHAKDAAEPSSVAVQQAGAARIPAILRVRCAHLPSYLTIRQAGVVWLDVRIPQDFPLDLQVEIPDDPAGIEVQVSAAWPAGLPETAIGLELEPDGHEVQRQTLWTSNPDLEELVVFRWK